MSWESGHQAELQLLRAVKDEHRALRAQLEQASGARRTMHMLKRAGLACVLAQWPRAPNARN